jgi:hypothetical protein
MARNFQEFLQEKAKKLKKFLNCSRSRRLANNGGRLVYRKGTRRGREPGNPAEREVSFMACFVSL